MSRPITTCLIAKAARNQGGSRKLLSEIIDYNLTKGGFSVWPCKCVPPCEKPTTQQLLELCAAVPKMVILLDR